MKKRRIDVGNLIIIIFGWIFFTAFLTFLWELSKYKWGVETTFIDSLLDFIPYRGKIFNVPLTSFLPHMILSTFIMYKLNKGKMVIFYKEDDKEEDK